MDGFTKREATEVTYIYAIRKDLRCAVLEAASLPARCASAGQTGNIAPNPRIIPHRTLVTGRLQLSEGEDRG